MSAASPRQALNAIWLILFASKGRRLEPVELNELERQCSILCEGMTARPITARALMDLAYKVRSSGIMASGQTNQLQSLLDNIESLKLLVSN